MGYTLARWLGCGSFLFFSLAVPMWSQLKPFVPDPRSPQLTLFPDHYGGYSGHFLRGGRGLAKPLPEADPILGAEAAWTLSAWITVSPGATPDAVIAGIGERDDEDSRLFSIEGGTFALRLGAHRSLRTMIAPGSGWHLLDATFSAGNVRFFVDGSQLGEQALLAAPVRHEFVLAPVETSCDMPVCAHFGGSIAQLTLRRGAMSAVQIAAQSREKPDFSLIAFEEGSKPWPLQTVQFAGNTAPQDPATLPQRKAPFSKPTSAPLPPDRTTLQLAGEGDWILQGGWKLAAAPGISASAKQIASPGFDTHGWLAADVPGTVLTTMIARGLYPDPDFGLNNLAIPESLNKQDYWYRAEFRSPQGTDQSHLHLVLNGVNYRAMVWLNGECLGEMTGAFKRGVFDAAGRLHPDETNVLAIRVSPAPHPGIPNVQSIAFGAGLNGGAMELDGPTFMATEGWDWFPPMHDRDTGLWQDVHLVASGAVILGDPQVVTHLPLPDISQAYVRIDVPLQNNAAHTVKGMVTAAFEGVSVQKEVSLPPGESVLHLTPAEFSQLHLEKPRLWWPNGYGRPELYHLKTTFSIGGVVSSARALQFGVREVSYEVSLLDGQGDLRRVEYDPTVDRDAAHSAVDVRHEAMRQVPGGWASSIQQGDDTLQAMHTVTDARGTPDMFLKVNGVRIAVRGGSWGMDDTRKRISRDHLEPFFRLDHDANVNIIRNWQGQNTEPVFYELADEYGMMVWNDFWEVTTDSNAEAEDPQLFLANAKDTILRYRNHPSIVMWCGRNEGVPQPVINQGLISLTHEFDGTRYYSPSSNQVNLEPSGPYSYEDPAAYYTSVDRGFAVEVGTSSLPTLEWFDRWLPKEDQWPIDDDWGYHNWHPHDDLNAHMQAQFGVATDLRDYVRKAQMMNYVDYRAIFEGFNQHLWAPNGGRLLWMTQPAWPSMLWGILSSDYDTQASYYATKKACEPLHVQLDLATDEVAVINTTLEPLRGATVTADVYSVAGSPLQHRAITLNAASDDVTEAMRLDLPALEGKGTVFVRLQLRDAQSHLQSDNFYWRARGDAGYRALAAMPLGTVQTRVRVLPRDPHSREQALEVHLHNAAAVPVLETKLALFDEQGAEILPAYYSDNYISLLPGEDRVVRIQIPEVKAHGTWRLLTRGWNLAENSQRFAATAGS